MQFPVEVTSKSLMIVEMFDLVQALADLESDDLAAFLCELSSALDTGSEVGNKAYLAELWAAIMRHNEDYDEKPTFLTRCLLFEVESLRNTLA